MVILTIGVRAKFFGAEIDADEFFGAAATRSFRATNFRKRPGMTRGSIAPPGIKSNAIGCIRTNVRGRG
jgi:hypothetical protein